LTGTTVLDYSWARPSPESCADWPGCVGVMRYVGPGNNGRDITRAELESLWAVGLGVGLVYESTANRALSGYAGGCEDGDKAAMYAHQLGWPDLPVYFACDCDVSTGQAYGAVLDYFTGTMGQAFDSRAYGEADVLDAVAVNLGFRHGWQPAASSWSDGRTSVHASMLQRWPYVMDNQCDNNDVTCGADQIDWLWEGGDVPLTAADISAINQACTDAINTALGAVYTGSRALQAKGDPGVYQLVVKDGQLCRRHIPSPGQIAMLQWVDGLAGARGDPPRVITDEQDKAEFLALPVID
jgi:hypothetical protein